MGDSSYRTHGLHFSLFLRREEVNAVEGMFGYGRKNSVCESPDRGRVDGGTVQGVRHLPQNRLQDLRSLPGMWGGGTDRPQPSTPSLCAQAAVSGRELYSPCEAGARELGCP